jgi:hypothetical protein
MFLRKNIINDKNVLITNDNKPVFSYMNSKPFFFHGTGTYNMCDLIKKLKYKITDDEINNINKKSYYSYIHKLKYYFTQLFIF